MRTLCEPMQGCRLPEADIDCRLAQFAAPARGRRVLTSSTNRRAPFRASGVLFDPTWGRLFVLIWFLAPEVANDVPIHYRLQPVQSRIDISFPQLARQFIEEFDFVAIGITDIEAARHAMVDAAGESDATAS